MPNGLPLFPPAASTMAGQVDALFWFLTLGSGLITLGIFGAIVYFSVRYRRRPGRELGDQVVGSYGLEAAWTIIPLGLAMVPFAWGARLYLDQSRPPDNSLEIYVVAKQWMWKVQHPEGQSEIDELHVPVGQPVKLTMTSQDVIHSFFVPEFRVKADVLPGRYTTTWFEATRVGEYHLFCAEYCGTDHSMMIGRIVAMQPADYAAWLAGGPTISPADQGNRLFQQLGCVACHAGGSLQRAPSLQGIYGQPAQLQDGTVVTADESYIRESILNPSAKVVAGYQPIMPSFAGRVDEEQLLALISYVKSLGPQPAGAGAPPAPGQAAAAQPSPSPSPAPAPVRRPSP